MSEMARQLLSEMVEEIPGVPIERLAFTLRNELHPGDTRLVLSYDGDPPKTPLRAGQFLRFPGRSENGLSWSGEYLLVLRVGEGECITLYATLHHAVGSPVERAAGIFFCRERSATAPLRS